MDLASTIAPPNVNIPTQLDPSSPLLRFIPPPAGMAPAIPAPQLGTVNPGALPAIPAPSLRFDPAGGGSASAGSASPLRNPFLALPQTDPTAGITQTLTNNSQLLAQNHDIIASPAQARQLAAQQRVDYLTRSGAGVDQIAHPVDANGNPTTTHPGFWRTLGSIGAHIGDDVLTLAAPGIAALTPGTTLHHEMLLNQAEGQEGQATNELQSAATLQDTQARARQSAALAEQDEAKAYSLTHPTPPKPVAPKVNFSQGGAPYSITGADGNEYAFGDPNMPADLQPIMQGALNAYTQGETAKSRPLTAAQAKALNGVWDAVATQHHLPTGQFSEGMAASDATQLAGSLNNAVGAMQKQTRIEVNPGRQGTWALDEDKNGNPVLLNSVTGQVKPAPAGVQKPGTFAKAQEEMQPAQDALNYANTYLASKTHTGSGDEALLEKFFELSKPSKGFRMTQPQIDMLRNAQSWHDSANSWWHHVTNGTYFSDTQRQQIVDTMRALAAAKMQGAKGGAPQSTDSGSNADPLGVL